MKKEKYWGYHLLVNAAGCNENINNPDIVKEFIILLVAKLKMHPLGKPTVVYVDTEEGKGVSATQIITTSTITFHGDNEGKRIFVDVFSCKEYQPETVLSLINSYFSPIRTEKRLIYRDASENCDKA